MSTCIANFLNLEKLAKELLRHGTDHFVQEQVLVDRIQVSLRSEAPRLDVLADDLDVLRRVLHVLELHPVHFMHLGCVELVVTGF